jgi:hypothetical protein
MNIESWKRGVGLIVKGPLLFVLLLTAGCAGPLQSSTPKTGMPAEVYISQPEVMKASNDTFDVNIKPIKVKKPYYVGFQLTVRNKSSNVLFIDWNRTRFIHDGKEQGKFIFKKVHPGDGKKGFSMEPIPGGALLSKPIYPVKTVDFISKQNVSKQESLNFSPGILPVGINAAVLAIAQGERQWRQAMTFKLDKTRIK